MADQPQKRRGRSTGAGYDPRLAGLDGLRHATESETVKRPPARSNMLATLANSRHIRHEQILERWPVLAEPWARMVERTRLEAIDRTPGAASFGR